jgi:hypothetical protein
MKRILKINTNDKAVIRKAKAVVADLATKIYVADNHTEVEDAVDRAIEIFDTVCTRIKPDKAAK